MRDRKWVALSLLCLFFVSAQAWGIGRAYSILVDKSSNKLMLYFGDKLLKTYVVSTGANDSTPLGTFRVTTKLENPTWYKPGKVAGPQDKRNRLGTRWIGLSAKGYGIHGTTEPEKLGQSVSAGCVRMRNKDVEELFPFVKPGTEVTIRN